MITTFTALDGRKIHVDHGRLYGDTELIGLVQSVISTGAPCGCNYWGEITPSLDTDWKAYLTVCGALKAIYGQHPDVTGVPNNPDGYDPEGPAEAPSR